MAAVLRIERDPFDNRHRRAADNRRIETTFWDLHRFNEEGLIVETWNVVDGLAILQQLKAGGG